ncbi:MAG: putative ABC transport system permease protein [Halieaceae bacterium]|jgi:putative ABC transport system permease protein
MILRTLLSHYRRHPMQALFLLSGIVIANVLLVGTQLINAQARASYERGEQILGSGPVGRVIARDNGAPIDERLFVALRRQGFDQVAPMLNTFLRTSEGKTLELLGVDALSMPPASPANTSRASEESSSGFGATGFGDFAFPPFAVLAAPARLKQLDLVEGAQLTLANGATLPPLRAIASEELGHRMLIDLGALQELTQMRGQLSSLLVFEQHSERLAALLRALPDQLQYVAQDNGPDPAQLTRSLHLNLAAMGLLACVVGLFLTYNAIAFSYTDRRELLRKLRLAGVARAELASALLLELAVFLLAGCALGLWLGGVLAARLLPGLGLTLAQLYDVYIAYPDTLLPSGYWLPLLVTAIAALACAWFPLRQALYAPILERWSEGWRMQSALTRDRRLLMVGVALLVAAVVVAQFASSIWVALGGMACLLLGAALCLPALLRWVLQRLSNSIPAQAVRWSWLSADSRWLLGPAALALMAMTLALVANSGLNTMIGSFRAATDSWLEQRLAAQLFVRDESLADPQRLAELDTWLAAWAGDKNARVAFTPRYRVNIDIERPASGVVSAASVARVEIADLSEQEPFRSSVALLKAAPAAEELFFAGDGVYISERAWRLDGWHLGDRVSLCKEQPELTVVGVYHDYGNPRSQWMVSPARFRRCWPELAPVGIGIHGPAAVDWQSLRAQLLLHFEWPDSAIIDQRELREVGLRVFDRTFAVTRALNLLTLVVAGIGIFCSVSAIHHHRVGQQALLASLGLSRRERGWMLLCQWGVLGAICTLLVWPFGAALAWYLAAVVTPVAFGWSFPLQLELAPYARLAALATAALLLAVVFPSLRLLRVSPAAMLREQNT